MWLIPIGWTLIPLYLLSPWIVKRKQFFLVGLFWWFVNCIFVSIYIHTWFVIHAYIHFTYMVCYIHIHALHVHFSITFFIIIYIFKYKVSKLIWKNIKINVGWLKYVHIIKLNNNRVGKNRIQKLIPPLKMVEWCMRSPNFTLNVHGPWIFWKYLCSYGSQEKFLHFFHHQNPLGF
jgi:hypothetical protein